jgi:uncharacterized membrane protein (UPF0127 family)
MAWLEITKKYYHHHKVFCLTSTGLFFIILVFFVIFLLKNKQNLQAGACIFQVEKVQSAYGQYRGLSGRNKIAADEGMLFLFADTSDRTFVMRKMNFPLDIVFIRDHRIINLYHDLPPEDAHPSSSYHSGAPVDAVLEINAGRSQACRLGVGTLVSW